MAVDVFEQPRSCSRAVRVCLLIGALTALWLVLGVVGSHGAEAAPASPHTGTTRQPDGEAFRSRLFGDEWYHGRETVTGYTVVQDEAGFWRYATRTKAGRLRPSRRVVGRHAPGLLRKHLRDQVQAQRGAQLSEETELPDPLSLEPATVAQSTSLVTPTTTHRSLVILASFNDQPPVTTTAGHWSDRFFGAAGSVKDYYEEASYGSFSMVPAAESSGTADDGVVGWVQLDMAHPQGDYTKVRRMVRAAVLAADASVNFAPYDANGDGVLVASELHVTVVAAGYEGAYHTIPKDGKALWAHRWVVGDSVSPPVVDGKTVTGGDSEGKAGYTTFGEMHNDHQATVGIIAHELGHDIGWPDLYDTDDPEVSEGVGNWSVMGGGSWLYLGGQWPGATPAHPDAWSKWLQGWITPTAITSSTLSAPVNAAASATKDNVALQVRDNPGGAIDWRMYQDTGAGEYFLIENRQRTTGTYDAALPGVGLLVWHINEAQADNDTNADRLVDLEEADGRGDLDAGANRGDAGDPYPGTAGNRLFSSTSSPSSRLNVSNHYSGVTIESISDSGPVMTANVHLPTPNDAFQAATEIVTQSHASTQRITEATRQPGEPTACNVDRSVWFEYTPAHDMTIGVNTLGSPVDTALGVFTGDSLGSLAPVACNDNDPAGGTTSALSFAATANTTYYVQVGNGAAAPNSVGDVSIALQARPGNDALSKRRTLGGASGVVAGTNVLATKESGEPAHGALPGGEGGASVWYSWTPPERQRVAFETAATSPLLPLLAVYEGETVESLTPVAQGAAGSATTTADRRVEFVAIPGHTYHIAVDGTKPLNGDASQGVFDLTWTRTARPPDAPASVTAARGESSAAVSWSVPAFDGGSPITGYTVTAAPGGATATVAASATSATVGTLTNGTAYTFTVRATNDVGDSAESTPSNSVVPAAPPGAPTGVTASRGDTSATVTWTAPASDGGSPITSYTVTTSPGGGTSVAGSSARSLTVSGLTNGTTYTFTVRATNDVGTSPASEASAPVTPATTPDPVRDVTAVRANESAELTWTAPASDGGSPLTGYTVTTSPGGAQTTAAPDSTGATVEGLTNGTSYTFTVTATNSIGDGPASAPSNSVVPATVPGAPTAAIANPSDRSAVVSWSAPSSDGGSPVTSYTITASPGGHSATLDNVTAETPLTATVTGLTNATAYTFTVTATNDVGAGSPSAPSEAVTPAALPGLPTDVEAVRGSASGTVTVTWTAPADDGGSPVTKYTVTSNPGSISAEVANVTADTPLTATVTGLTNGTAYTFTVTATNGTGPGTASAPSNSVTPATTPGMPTGVTAAPRDRASVVSWSPPTIDGGSPITTYTVTSTPGDHTAKLENITPETPLTATVAGLTNGTAYTFTVTATNEVGAGDASGATSPITPATIPDAPVNVQATRADASAAVTWAPPDNDGGTPITGYIVTALPGGSTWPAGADATSTTATGLTNGTPYTFTVTATNAMGNSTASEASPAVTPARSPGVPLNVTVERGDAAATVSWAAPSDDGGSAITGYSVTTSPGGVVTKVGADLLSVTVPGLTNGTTYTFAVTATNDVGDGDSSAQVTGETVAPVPKFAAMSMYSLPTKVTATWTVTENGSGLAWYHVRSQRRGLTGAVVEQSDWQKQTAAKLTLTTQPGSTYCFEVTATDNAGNTTSRAVRQCTTAPMDDRILEPSRGWTSVTAKGYYRNTYRITKAHGAKLISPSFKARRVSLVATKCPGCGSVKVVAGGESRTISLHASTTKRRAVILVGTFPLKTTKASITVTSSRKPVRIDGLAFSTRSR